MEELRKKLDALNLYSTSDYIYRLATQKAVDSRKLPMPLYGAVDPETGERVWIVRRTTRQALRRILAQGLGCAPEDIALNLTLDCPPAVCENCHEFIDEQDADCVAGWCPYCERNTVRGALQILNIL